MKYFLQLRCFKVEFVSVSSKCAYSDWVMKHMYLSKENHVCKNLDHLAHCLPVRIQLVIERDTSCNLGVSSQRFVLLPPNWPLQLT
jgi:hypothetical protein